MKVRLVKGANELRGTLHTITDNYFVVEIKGELKHYHRLYWDCKIVKERKKNV